MNEDKKANLYKLHLFTFIKSIRERNAFGFPFCLSSHIYIYITLIL